MSLSHRDAAELERYLGDGSNEKSTLGPQLDRLSMFAVKTRRHGEVTVRITAEVREQGKNEPDVDRISRYGRASRRLKQVADDSPILAAALVALYGDGGSKWARGRLGRVGALLHLTVAGQNLARRAAVKARGAKLDVSDSDRIETEVSLQELQPLAQRETLLQQAIRQACELKDRAEDAYSATGRVAG